MHYYYVLPCKNKRGTLCIIMPLLVNIAGQQVFQRFAFMSLSCRKYTCSKQIPMPFWSRQCLEIKGDYADNTSLITIHCLPLHFPLL